MPVTRVVVGQLSLDGWQYILDPTSIAELTSFATITTDSGGADPLEAEAQIVLRLEGAGGKLNFSSRIGGAHSVRVEDIGLTSKVALTGTVNDDVLNGSAFADTLNGGAGADALAGGAGNDIYYVDNAGDSVTEIAGGGIDTVRTTLSSFTLGAEVDRVEFTGLGNFVGTGNALANVLTGGAGKDTLSGEDGNDKLNGETGADGMTGGIGSDTYYVDDAGDAVTESADAGIDTVRTTLSSYELGADVERLVFTGSGNFAGIGNALANKLTGGAGSDTLSGDDGNDSLNGGTGADGMTGGAGNDTYFVDDAGDTVAEIAGGGIDTVRTTLSSYTLGSEVDRLRFIGSGDFVGTGNGLANVLTGGAGNDSLDGGLGDDTIMGAQNDTLLDGGGGTDTLRTAVAFTSTGDGQVVNIEKVLLTQAVTLNLANQSEGFTITGSAGIDSITGGSSSDAIAGAQNDTLLDGGGGTDTLRVGANFASTGDGQIASIEQVLLTHAVTLSLANQTEGFTITGSAGADSITGGSGADSISAGAGNDTIAGAVSDTLLDGGDDTDTLRVGTAFTSTGNGQIVNIEQVLLTQAVTLSLANQTEGFTITGSSGADSISGGSGADTIAGAQDDTLLNGNGGTDTLQVGANFTSTGNIQISNIEQVLLTQAVTLNLANQFEGFTIIGSSGIDSISGGGSLDTIVGTQDDTLLNGNGGIDTLQVGADFTSTGNGQIANIEQVLLAQAVALNLANQTEGFIITGSAGIDSITGGAGNDTIAGAQNDTLLDGGGGSADVLQVGVNFTSTTNGQVANIEQVLLTQAVALNLSNQTEGFTITGSSGADSITGGSGADTIVGAQNDTLLNGNSGTDTLQVGANFTSIGNSQIVGIEQVLLAQAVTLNLANQTEGFTISGSSGIDSIAGGSGNDTIAGAQDDTLLNGNGGTDTLQVAVDFTSTANGQIVNIEKVLLTQGVTLNLANQSEGFAITGSSGADNITGGAGDDSISAGAGDDTIQVLLFVADFDRLDGGADIDTLQVGGAFFDSTSDDQIVNIEQVLLTQAGLLTLANQTEGFTITGSSGADSITGGSAADSISAGTGNDIIEGGSGADSISAGAGNDTIAGAANDALLDGGGEIDTLQVGGNFTSTGDGQIINIENVALTAAVTLNLANQTEAFTIAGSSGIDSITGGSGNDTIVGAVNDTLLDGGADTDTLRVGANFTSTGDGQIASIELVLLTQAVTLNLSNQLEGFTITGSSGADSITGGSANDTIVGAQNDTLLDGSGGSADVLQVGANFTSTGNGQIANIEQVLLAQAVALNLANQTEGFTITGSAGIDSITGGAGNDTIVGAQNDTLLDGSGGTDTLRLGAAFTSSGDIQIANIEQVLLASAVTLNLANQSEGFTITGSSGIDSISGGSGNDWVDGGAGNDAMDGGLGVDTMSYASAASGVTVNLSSAFAQNTLGAGTDVIAFFENLTGSSFDDILRGDSGNNVLDGGLGNDTVSYASASAGVTVNLSIAGAQATVGAGTDTLLGFENLTGSSFNDTLTGDDSNNVIRGAGGRDTLTGGAGDDTFIFAATAESTVAQPDSITDFVHGDDLIDFANIAGIDSFQGLISGGTVNANSIGWTESGGNTLVYVNTTAAGEAVGSAQMEIVLTGTNLGLTAVDFVHV